MPTVTKTIGSTGDFATVALWYASVPANLVTDGNSYTGQLQNQEFTTTGTIVNITGNTTDSTHFMTLTTASGASFRDNAGAASNPLTYDATKGAALRRTTNYNHTVSCSVNYTQLKYLQIANDETSGGDYALNITSGSNCVTDSCILRGGTGGRVAQFAGTAKNCLCLGRGASQIGVVSNTVSMFGCSIVSNTASSGAAVSTNGGTAVLKNCAIFGYAALTIGAGSSFNATDLGSLTGSSNQVSLTYASQFVGSTTDWRAVNTGSLKNGTPDSTNTPVDIIGQTRDLTTPYIGCWEVVSAAGAPKFIAENFNFHPLCPMGV